MSNLLLLEITNRTVLDLFLVHVFDYNLKCHNYAYLSRAVKLKYSVQYLMKLLRSVLLIPPIGLISALEQSYLVM